VASSSFPHLERVDDLRIGEHGAVPADDDGPELAVAAAAGRALHVPLERQLDRVRLDAEVHQPVGGDPHHHVGAAQQRGRVRPVDVEIGDDVELQANSCVDRAALGATVIESGVKADNLVQLAHNVHVGRDSVIAALTGVAGSTTIGRHAVIAAQVGIAGHLHIGDGATLTARAAVMNDVDPGDIMYGIPARRRRETLRLHVDLNRLPETTRKVRDLERQVAELERRLSLLMDGEEGKDG